MLSFIRRKMRAGDAGISRILETPADYDGYYLFPGSSEEALEINSIISRNLLNLEDIPIFNEIRDDSNSEDWEYFYDQWMDYLKFKGIVFYLDNEVSIEELTVGVNRILSVTGSSFRVDPDEVSAAYRQALYDAGVSTDFKYDLLEANVIQAALKGSGLELISIFDGIDGHNITIVPERHLLKLKLMERS